jgi:hypothetical protein
MQEPIVPTRIGVNLSFLGTVELDATATAPATVAGFRLAMQAMQEVSAELPYTLCTIIDPRHQSRERRMVREI